MSKTFLLSSIPSSLLTPPAYDLSLHSAINVPNIVARKEAFNCDGMLSVTRPFLRNSVHRWQHAKDRA